MDYKTKTTCIMNNAINKHREIQLTNKVREGLIFCICLICMCLFLSTAYFKLVEHSRFLNGLSKAPLIGRLAPYISWLVPSAEIAVSLLLIVPRTYKWGLYGFTGLMSLFTAYILSMLLWAEKLPCHCGGAIEKLSWTQHVWFNLAFVVLALYALRLSKLQINNNKY